MVQHIRMGKNRENRGRAEERETGMLLERYSASPHEIEKEKGNAAKSFSKDSDSGRNGSTCDDIVRWSQ